MWRFWLKIPKVGLMPMRLLFSMHSEHKHIILLFAFLASEALVHAIFYFHDCCAWSIAPGVSLPSWYTGFCYKRTQNKISVDFLLKFPLISKEITNDISMKNANLFFMKWLCFSHMSICKRSLCTTKFWKYLACAYLIEIFNFLAIWFFSLIAWSALQTCTASALHLNKYRLTFL